MGKIAQLFCILARFSIIFFSFKAKSAFLLASSSSSCKENDSINTPSAINSINTSLTNGPKNLENLTENTDSRNDDVVLISDEENSEKMEVDEEKSLPVLPENEVTRQIVSRQKNRWAFISSEEESLRSSFHTRLCFFR
jgi:hypothetical protein